MSDISTAPDQESELPLFPDPLPTEASLEQRLQYLQRIIELSDEGHDSEKRRYTQQFSLSNPVARFVLSKALIVDANGEERFKKKQHEHEESMRYFRGAASSIHDFLSMIERTEDFSSTSLARIVSALSPKAAYELWQRISSILWYYNGYGNGRMCMETIFSKLGIDSSSWNWLRAERDAWEALLPRIEERIAAEVQQAAEETAQMQSRRSSAREIIPFPLDLSPHGHKSAVAQIFGALRLAGITPWSSYKEIADTLGWPDGADNFRPTYHASFEPGKGLATPAFDVVKVMLAVADPTQRNQIAQVLREKDGLAPTMERITRGRSMSRKK